MCWYSYKKPELKIASEDIICYKVVYCELAPIRIYSFYRGFKYKLCKQYSIKDGLAVCVHEDLGTYRFEYTIDEGFHSYSEKPVIRDGNIECIDDTFRYGRHTFIAECIIPKGSVYYYNPLNCTLVSDAIIINEIIPNE